MSFAVSGARQGQEGLASLLSDTRFHTSSKPAKRFDHSRSIFITLITVFSSATVYVDSCKAVKDVR